MYYTCISIVFDMEGMYNRPWIIGNIVIHAIVLSLVVKNNHTSQPCSSMILGMLVVWASKFARKIEILFSIFQGPLVSDPCSSFSSARCSFCPAQRATLGLRYLPLPRAHMT